MGFGSGSGLAMPSGREEDACHSLAWVYMYMPIYICKAIGKRKRATRLWALTLTLTLTLTQLRARGQLLGFKMSRRWG